MSVTYYKGFVGKEDIEFGTGTFTRKDKDHTSRDLTQVHRGHIPRYVSIKTSSYEIPSIYGEYTFSNESAGGNVTFTLPPAARGLGPYTFFVSTGFISIIVVPSGTNYFRDCAAGKYKSSNITGNRLIVWCDRSTIWEWDYDVVTGYWADEA